MVTDCLDKFVTYPPKCRIHSPVQPAIGILNPFLSYPVKIQGSVLGFPRSTQEFIYFNRHTTVFLTVCYSILTQNTELISKTPSMLPTTWNSCSNGAVYVNETTGAPGRDTSIPSALSVLPNVIEKSVRTVIVHGLADFILIAEGTRIAIQNMSWGGAQGLQTPIEDETFTVQIWVSTGTCTPNANSPVTPIHSELFCN
ncbi:unnamed protein product [Cyclocybe aegerita]|uniref:Uncharacterized protein n=1 Tax=Cyclocybe aegerita TaxID=1973307 RepID=A0A8S0WGM2_CYCAE|nr:unnamed protein product [Cyclocybe aegerita]